MAFYGTCLITVYCRCIFIYCSYRNHWRCCSMSFAVRSLARQSPDIPSPWCAGPFSYIFWLMRRSWNLGNYSLRELKKSWKNPRGYQERYLLKILRENGDTEYCKRFGLKDVKSREDFRKRHPLITYRDLSALRGASNEWWKQRADQ